MTGEDLTAAQLEAFTAQVMRQLRYHNRVIARMERLGWSVNDPLWREALRVRDALQGLRMAAHYAGCPSGVGKPDAP